MNQALAALLMAGLSCGTALAAEPQAVIALQPYFGTKALHATVNGHEGIFLFDTGGGVSTVTPQFAAAVGCKPWGQVTGFRMTGQRLDFARCDDLDFQVGGLALHAPIAGVFDLTPLLPKDAPPLAGILALDAFAGRAVTVDLSAATLTVESPASLAARISQAKEVPLRLVRDAGGAALGVELGVSTARGTAWMELDTGSDGALIIGRHVAALFDLDPAAPKGQAAVLQVPGGIRLQGTALVKDLIMDGNIGVPVLKDWVMTLDLASGRAWLAPAAPRPQ
jgi:hypothetical protein